MMWFKRRHLTNEEIARCAEALKFDKPDQIENNLVEHIEKCSDCQIKVNEILTLIKADNYIDKPNYVSDIYLSEKKSKSDFKLFYTAASIAILIFIGAFLYWTLTKTNLKKEVYTPPKDNKKEIVQQNNQVSVPDKTPVNVDSVKQENLSYRQNNKPDSSIYMVYNPLEGLIGSELRSNDEFDVISPINGKVFKKGEPVIFKWKSVSTDSITIIINNNRGNIIYISGITGNPYKINKKLSPGLYYWKALRKKELIYVGKFTVK